MGPQRWYRCEIPSMGLDLTNHWNDIYLDKRYAEPNMTFPWQVIHSQIHMQTWEQSLAVLQLSQAEKSTRYGYQHEYHRSQTVTCTSTKLTIISSQQFTVARRITTTGTLRH
jgi:hypothetical protein